MTERGNNTLDDGGNNNSGTSSYSISSISQDDREELAGFAEDLGIFFCEYRDVLESLGMEGSDNRFSVSEAHSALEEASGRDSLEVDYVDRVLAASTIYDPNLTGAYLSSDTKNYRGLHDNRGFQKEYRFEI